MSNGAMAGANAGAAAGAAIAQAIKASGGIVKVEPAELVKILNRMESPLVVRAMSGLFKKKHQYLTSYKGIFFFAQSPDPIQCPSGTEYVAAGKILIP